MLPDLVSLFIVSMRHLLCLDRVLKKTFFLVIGLKNLQLYIDIDKALIIVACVCVHMYMHGVCI